MFCIKNQRLLKKPQEKDGCRKEKMSLRDLWVSCRPLVVGGRKRDYHTDM